MPEAHPRTARKKARQRTHDLILSAARDSFRSVGYHESTIRAIADSAGVAVGTVMSHCNSKEELLYEALQRAIDTTTEQVFQALPAGPLDMQLTFIAESFLRYYAQDAALNTEFLERSMFARGIWGERFAEQVTGIGSRIHELFSDAIIRDEIPSGVDVRATIATFFSIYYFTLIIQIKSRFADLDPGIEQLRWQIQHLYRGSLACAELN
jgi:AcrR family transcriptional regulator